MINEIVLPLYYEVEIENMKKMLFLLMREMEIVAIFGGRSWGAFNVWSQKQEKLKCWFSKFHFLIQL